MHARKSSFDAHLETAEPTYGCDKHGLVWGYLFLPGQTARQIDSDAVKTWLIAPRPVPSDSFLWLHFSLASAAAEGWLRSNLRLPAAFYAILHEDIGSTRLEQQADALVATLHDVLFDFTFDASSVSSVSLCIEPHLLVSVRLRPLRSVDRLRAAVRAGQAFRSPADLLAHLLSDQADVLVDIVRQSTNRVDLIED